MTGSTPPTYPPPIQNARPVLVVVSDLFFRAKIDEVARQLGLPLRVAKSAEQLERHLANATPSIAFIDLEADTIDPIAAIRRLMDTPTGPPVVGFAGHANVGVFQEARAAGATEVMARSAFQTRMPTILSRVADAERARHAGFGTRD